MGGVTSAAAQNECAKNSSIAREAAKVGNFKDAYLPWKEVIKDCPTLRYYTFTDGLKMFRAFLDGIKDRKSPEYQQYFNELMETHALREKYIPDFAARGTKVPSVASAIGIKALDYLNYAPQEDDNVAYGYLKESVEGEKENSEGGILHNFVQISLKRMVADPSLKDQFFQDYLEAYGYAEKAVDLEPDPEKKKGLVEARDNIEFMFVRSGAATCDDLQNIFGPKIEAQQTDSAFLKQTILLMKIMKCTESEAYFQASYYMYKINPTADAAVGCAYMSHKKGDDEAAIKYFDEAFKLESNSERKAQIAYAAATILTGDKRYAQAKRYVLEAIANNDKLGDAYILLAQIYAANANWSDQAPLNRCTYYAVLDKLARAKAVDPTVTERANELISTFRSYTPKMEDLFMLGIKVGDRVPLGGLIGETITVR
jgi:tetratricopeptide (TPR) repeat protein